MNKPKYTPGIYGNIQIIKFVGVQGIQHKRSIYLCKCLLCGKEFTSYKPTKIVSCGCKTTFKDVTGQRFGFLTALEPTRNNKVKNQKMWYWKCICDCGKYTLVSINNLCSGEVISCTCKRGKSLPKGVGAQRRVYDAYKANAKKRGHEFTLSMEIFLKITKQNCFYCDHPPSSIQKGKGGLGDFIYTGIDRVNNSKGYIIGNVVPCCHNCNIAKRALTLEEFISLAIRIANKFKI